MANFTNPALQVQANIGGCNVLNASFNSLGTSDMYSPILLILQSIIPESPAFIEDQFNSLRQDVTEADYAHVHIGEYLVSLQWIEDKN